MSEMIIKQQIIPYINLWMFCADVFSFSFLCLNTTNNYLSHHNWYPTFEIGYVGVDDI